MLLPVALTMLLLLLLLMQLSIFRKIPTKMMIRLLVKMISSQWLFFT